MSWKYAGLAWAHIAFALSFWSYFFLFIHHRYFPLNTQYNLPKVQLAFFRRSCYFFDFQTLSFENGIIQSISLISSYKKVRFQLIHHFRSSFRYLWTASRAKFKLWALISMLKFGFVFIRSSTLTFFFAKPRNNFLSGPYTYLISRTFWYS